MIPACPTSPLPATVGAMPAGLVQLRLVRAARHDRGVVIDAPVAELLEGNCVVAIGVSGGKDSCALAFATIAHLDAIGHKGPRVLVHADLGAVEWKDSLPTCQRLADRLGLELVVVRRAAGGMMERWEQRWRDNVRRYANLECVKLILPWSTPAMRFCTSELKVAPICAELVRRFPGHTIISASGIRRQESDGRDKAPISKPQKLLYKVRAKTIGISWNPILEWSEADVRGYLDAQAFALHEGYTHFGMTRISCAFCIMANESDLTASASCPDNAEIFRRMVELEIASTFAFQGSRWLADIAPGLLDDRQRILIADAKRKASLRAEIEAAIPDHLLYEKGWPKVMPTRAEAELLCRVRRDLAILLGINVDYLDPDALIARYAELMAENAERQASKERTIETLRRRTARRARAGRAPKGVS